MSETPDSHPELGVDPDSPPLHRQPVALALVFAGGVVGTGVRYWLEKTWPAASGAWPWATFGINLTGAFILGLLLETLARLGPDDGWRQRIRLLAGTGLCGAYTTYSAFALEISLLGRDGAVGIGIAYAVTSVVVGVLCAWLGIVVAARVLPAARETAA